jgi:hypothetical protein
VTVIDFKAVKHANDQIKQIRFLDLKASYTALDVCLKTLKINNLKELESVKIEIEKTMKALQKIENNA